MRATVREEVWPTGATEEDSRYEAADQEEMRTGKGSLFVVHENYELISLIILCIVNADSDKYPVRSMLLTLDVITIEDCLEIIIEVARGQFQPPTATVHSWRRSLRRSALTALTYAAGLSVPSRLLGESAYLLSA